MQNHFKTKSSFTAAVVLVAASLLTAAPSALAQDVPNLDREALLKQLDGMMAEAKASPLGYSSKSIQPVGKSYVSVVVRMTSGQSEQHRVFADFFVPLEGEADLVVGGTLLEGKATADGEVRGTAIKGGVHHHLKPGTMFTVPAGTPHQTFLIGGKPFKALVIKIAERD